MTAWDRFLAKIEETSEGCWVWKAARDKDGYGVFKLSQPRRQVKSHRYAYEQLKGPIPQGLGLDHLCRNRACCNPAHLEPASAATNQRRGLKAKVDEDEVVQIRLRAARGEPQRQIARDYGISQAQVSLIVTRKRWSDL